MKSIYKVKVNKTIDLELTSKELSNADIIQISTNNYHLIQNNKSIKAIIEKSDFDKKTYTVSINDNSYKIQIQNDLDLLINKMGFTIGKSKLVYDVKAPMPGLVLDINVKIGDEVKENDTLLILEAMKMENSIASPRNGVIKNIAVNKGDAIDKGALLIEFE